MYRWPRTCSTRRPCLRRHMKTRNRGQPRSVKLDYRLQRQIRYSWVQFDFEMAVADHSRTVSSTVARLLQAILERCFDPILVCSAVTQRPVDHERSLVNGLDLYNTKAADGLLILDVDMPSGRAPRQAVMWKCAFRSGVLSRVSRFLGHPLDHQLAVRTELIRN